MSPTILIMRIMMFYLSILPSICCCCALITFLAILSNTLMIIFVFILLSNLDWVRRNGVCIGE